MNRGELKKYIFESYGTEPDCPWPKYPSYEVFRHGENRKWFALICIPSSPVCRTFYTKLYIYSTSKYWNLFHYHLLTTCTSGKEC